MHSELLSLIRGSQLPPHPPQDDGNPRKIGIATADTVIKVLENTLSHYSIGLQQEEFIYKAHSQIAEIIQKSLEKYEEELQDKKKLLEYENDTLQSRKSSDESIIVHDDVCSDWAVAKGLVNQHSSQIGQDQATTFLGTQGDLEECSLENIEKLKTNELWLNADVYMKNAREQLMKSDELIKSLRLANKELDKKVKKDYEALWVAQDQENEKLINSVIDLQLALEDKKVYKVGALNFSGKDFSWLHDQTMVEALRIIDRAFLALWNTREELDQCEGLVKNLAIPNPILETLFQRAENAGVKALGLYRQALDAPEPDIAEKLSNEVKQLKAVSLQLKLEMARNDIRLPGKSVMTSTRSAQSRSPQKSDSTSVYPFLRGGGHSSSTISPSARSSSSSDGRWEHLANSELCTNQLQEMFDTLEQNMKEFITDKNQQEMYTENVKRCDEVLNQGEKRLSEIIEYQFPWVDIDERLEQLSRELDNKIEALKYNLEYHLDNRQNPTMVTGNDDYYTNLIEELKDNFHRFLQKCDQSNTNKGQHFEGLLNELRNDIKELADKHDDEGKDKQKQTYKQLLNESRDEFKNFLTEQRDWKDKDDQIRAGELLREIKSLLEHQQCQAVGEFKQLLDSAKRHLTELDQNYYPKSENDGACKQLVAELNSSIKNLLEEQRPVNDGSGSKKLLDSLKEHLTELIQKSQVERIEQDSNCGQLVATLKSDVRTLLANYQTRLEAHNDGYEELQNNLVQSIQTKAANQTEVYMEMLVEQVNRLQQPLEALIRHDGLATIIRQMFDRSYQQHVKLQNFQVIQKIEAMENNIKVLMQRQDKGGGRNSRLVSDPTSPTSPAAGPKGDPTTGYPPVSSEDPAMAQLYDALLNTIRRSVQESMNASLNFDLRRYHYSVGGFQIPFWATLMATALLYSFFSNSYHEWSALQPYDTANAYTRALYINADPWWQRVWSSKINLLLTYGKTSLFILCIGIFLLPVMLIEARIM